MVEFTAQTPGILTLLDHSIFRLHQGAVATFTVTGPNNPAIIVSIKNGTEPPPAWGQAQRTWGHQKRKRPPVPETQSSTNSTEVVIENFAYNPADMSVPAGTTVTWVNEDSVGHTVTEREIRIHLNLRKRFSGFDSSGGKRLPGKGGVNSNRRQSWSYTFTTSRHIRILLHRSPIHDRPHYSQHQVSGSE